MAARKKAKPKPRARKAKKAKKVKRPRKKMGKAWSRDEIQFLRASYKRNPASKIAKELKRSLASVRGKISALGLTKGRARKAKPKPKPKKKARPKARAKARPKKKAKPKAKAKRKRR